ncbi:MAG: hypothetical protein AMXMBFR4_14080 [Candidatus Hydrogenedentota bacterium]
MIAAGSILARIARGTLCLCAALLCYASTAIRAPIDQSATAAFRNGRILVLECRPPAGAQAEAFLKRYLAEGVNWKMYADKGAVAIRFGDLNPMTQRAVMLTLFRHDYVDDKGWHHTAVGSGRDRESLWALAEWLTGKGTNQEPIANANKLQGGTLEEGQRILIPRDLLSEIMRKPSPKPADAVPVESAVEEAVDLSAAGRMLTFKTRGRKEYAIYKLRPGEALYTSVVVRFTDFGENKDILAACEVIQRESGIADVHDMRAGTEVYIPVEMLSDRFKPASSPDRQEYEAIAQEAARLRGQVSTRNLEGVVVILDPGHGGKDQGTSMVKNGYRLYEDEINYDIVCRIKKLLETQTQARVHVTMLDPDQGYEPRDVEQFEHDEDEVVLVSPNYWNGDAKVSANLRWYLANSLYRYEVNRGIDPRKVVFTSVHCDALFNGKLRGAMVYIPGAAHRRDSERGGTMAVYGKYKEVQEAPESRSTAAERRRDEALSRNFAETLLEELGKARIKRHSVGDPVRNVIRQSGGKEYVPAVLRNTLVPTKVLVECANLTNETDCQWVSQPWWRQRFAEAYVAALRAHFDHADEGMIASTR